MVAENEKITWYPEHIKHGRFGKWLENNVDWALSRERYWGTPLPVWRCDEGHEHAIGSVAELRGARRRRCPRTCTSPTSTTVTFPCGDCGGEMHRVPEVIDAWYDSGSMPFAQWHYPFENEDVFEERFPADYICEALDQTRGWFYSLLAVSTLLYGRSSYETCLCLGLILDPEGQKMSKSKGNVIVPVGRDRRARRGRVPLVLLHLEAAVGRLPLLARRGRRVASASSCSSSGTRTASSCCTRT